MSKLAVITSFCNDIAEVNNTQHYVRFMACIKDTFGGFNGPVLCRATIDQFDNANKVRDAFVDAVVEGAAENGVVLQRSDVSVPSIYRAP